MLTLHIYRLMFCNSVMACGLVRIQRICGWS